MSLMNVKNRILKNNDGFCLRLANGQRWHIVGSKEIKPLIEKLTTVMELKTCEPNGYPKLIFIQRESDEELEPPTWSRNVDILEGLPRDGWHARNLGALKLWSHRDVPDVICEARPERNHDLDIIRMWLSLHPIYMRAQDSGGLPMHAALVVKNRIGVLLSAPGATGKSTCCRRLPLIWQALCDDETLVVQDNQKKYWAHPFPTWSNLLRKRSEHTWNVQQHFPLSAMFFLEQGETDIAIPVGQGEATILITQSARDVWQRSLRNLNNEQERALRNKLFDNSCQLAKAVPTFSLRVSLNGRFWEEMEKVLENAC
jgi:SynChlorMet cassette protein ScmC